MTATDYPDFEGGKQRVYLTPEWAAKEAVDKTFVIAPNNMPAVPGLLSSGTYLVPAGKTLYITHVSFLGYATAAADRELNQGIWGQLYVGVDVRYEAMGSFGVTAVLSKPVVVVAGETLGYGIANVSNHNIMVGCLIAGYEV